MALQDFDLIVIGGGAGGTAAALRAAQLGGRVSLVEKNHFGGFCMNRGCIPFSQMSLAADFLNKVSSLVKDIGIETNTLKLNLTKLNRRQGELVNGMREGIRSLLSKARVQVKYGEARFLDNNTICVGDQKLTARNIIGSS